MNLTLKRNGNRLQNNGQKTVMTKKIDEIFSHENQVDFFFKGIDVHMGMVDETTIAVLRILDKCF